MEVATWEEKTRVILQQNVYLSQKTRISFLTLYNDKNPTKIYYIPGQVMMQGDLTLLGGSSDTIFSETLS